MEYRLLGPLEAGCDGQQARLGPHQRKQLLAVLVLRANQLVSTDRIADLLWGDHSPPTAGHAIQVHVSELRRELKQLDPDVAIVHLTPGYVLRADPESIDVNVFECLVGEGCARLNEGEAAAAVGILSEALQLWRGPPLADFGYDDFAQEDIRRLEARHLQALEALAAAELDLGHDRQALDLAERVVEQAPLRENPRRTQMIALYRVGRHAEALRAYDAFRQTLVEGLGQEPSPTLNSVYERILIHDPTLGHDKGSDREAEPRNPYKGLRSFTETDADHFFGRRELIESMLEVLNGDVRLLCLVGPSGCGKTSAIDAGLLPAIRRGAVSGSEWWTIRRVRMRRQPSRNLARAIGQVARSTPAGGTLLVIDQFEQVFLDSDQAERQTALEALAQAVVSPSLDLRAALALRADFYDQPLTHPSLARLLVPGVVSVLPLTPDELEEAITEPARLVGVSVEPALLAELIADTAGRSGGLPLLEFGLSELFERREGHGLTLRSYQALRGLRGILTGRAEAAYEQLGLEGRIVAKQVLLRMVGRSLTEKSVARRVSVRELSGLALDPATLSEVLGRLGENRLICFGGDPEGEGTWVEVSHESVFHLWDRLAGWVESLARDLEVRDGLTRRVAEWEAAGRPDDDLPSGTRLAGYEAWSRQTDLALTSDERAYLAAGIARRDAERAAEAALRETEARIRRRARLGVTGLAASLILVFLVGVFLIADPFAGPPPEAVLLIPARSGGGLNDLLESGFDEAITATGLTSEELIEPLDRFDDKIHQIAAAGTELIVVAADTPGRAALDHPETRFIAIEYLGEVDNVSSLDVANEEASFLVGAVAALTSDTGHVAFLAGGHDAGAEVYEAGFRAGVAHVAPETAVSVVYLTESPRGFSEASRAGKAATDLYRSGVDVIFHVVGAGSQEVLYASFLESAAEGRHLWAIGVGVDQFLTLPLGIPRGDRNPADWTPHVLTTVIKRYDLALQTMIEHYAAGNLALGSNRFGLADGVIGLSRSGGFIDHLDETLRDLESQIVAGRIKVPTDQTH